MDKLFSNFCCTQTMQEELDALKRKFILFDVPLTSNPLIVLHFVLSQRFYMKGTFHFLHVIRLLRLALALQGHIFLSHLCFRIEPLSTLTSDPTITPVGGGSHSHHHRWVPLSFGSSPILQPVGRVYSSSSSKLPQNQTTQQERINKTLVNPSKPTNKSSHKSSQPEISKKELKDF